MVALSRRPNGLVRSSRTRPSVVPRFWSCSAAHTPKQKGCTRMHSCTKKPYASYGYARTALAALRKSGYPTLSSIHWCAEHSAWHTTRNVRRGRRRDRYNA